MIHLATEWRCPCGEWVNGRYPAHAHAFIPRRMDPATKRLLPVLGGSIQVETIKRAEKDPVRRVFLAHSVWPIFDVKKPE